jgi:hydrogenase nickel incorporation protein HypA/HybF
MHELSIALGLVELASEEAARQGRVRVETLYVRVGALSGVVPSALRFSFDVAAGGTAIEGAVLEIEEVAGRTLELAALEVTDVAADRGSP